MLCGADMLESFAVPDLWSTEDVRPVFLFVHIVVAVAIFPQISFAFVKELTFISVCLKFFVESVLLIIEKSDCISYFMIQSC